MPEAGYVIGIDSNGRNKQNRESNPPGHAMSGLRFTATQREIWRASPSLLLEMRSHPDKVSTSPAISSGGVTYPALTYQAGPYWNCAKTSWSLGLRMLPWMYAKRRPH